MVRLRRSVQAAVPVGQPGGLVGHSTRAIQPRAAPRPPAELARTPRRVGRIRAASRTVMLAYGAVVKHAPGSLGNDYTLCGLAHEAAEDAVVIGETEPVVIACAGEYVTCPDCQRVVDHCKGNFGARYRVTP
jgi:hypothetical protein